MQSGAMIFYSVFMSTFTATCLGLAAYKLIMFIQVKGCQESIPQTILIMELVANISTLYLICLLYMISFPWISNSNVQLVRFVASAVDPLQSRAILPHIANQMLFTTSWPFVIINLLLVSFYW